MKLSMTGQENCDL